MGNKRFYIHREMREESGTALVEFTLILILFLSVLFGIVEYGFLLYNQQVITNAGREGARFGIVARPNGMEIHDTEIIGVVQAYAQNNVVSFGNKNFNVTAQFDNSLAYCDQFQDKLTVTVRYDYSFLFLPFGTKTLSSTAIMYCE